MRLVALWRGINVGRAKRVAMADLRDLLASLGYSDVRTLLNSGNAVISARAGSAGAIAARIETAVATRLGVSACVIAKSAKDFRAIVAANPLLGIATDPSRLLVAFTQDRSALSAVKGLTKVSWAPEALAIGGQAAYIWCPSGILASTLAQSVGRQLGERVTTRNWSTVVKLNVLL